ncbi:MAG: PIG-L family deacetylase [Chitinispirillaceae bacterium]|nr:PIG-L family deacetylase [Chitinispirillaceae bacterium]
MKMDHDKVLVLSPHTDDAELGAGGTIAKFLEEGIEIFYVVFSGCEISVPDGMAKETLREECKTATSILGLNSGRVSILNYPVRKFPEYRQDILDAMIQMKDRYLPNLILVPSSSDMHQDHRVICEEALRAFKRDSSIWGYEHPWNNLVFTTDIFIKLSKEQVEKKLASLRAYHSQSDKSYMSEDSILSLIRTRGTQLDVSYAEAFELIRMIY